MSNVGWTCYFNSLLQSLYSLNSFSNLFTDANLPADYKTSPGYISFIDKENLSVKNDAEKK